MKKILIVLSTLLMLTALIVGISISAAAEDPTSGTCGENLTWVFDESTGELTISGTGNMEHIEFFTFLFASSITSVKIEDGVTSIGDVAFAYCENLTSVSVPSSITSIEYGAFYRCKNLTSVTLPDSLTSIGEAAFRGCESLVNITIPDSVTTICAETFADCKSLTNVTIPEGVTSIGSTAFAGCESLTSITIPNGVTSIEPYVFQNCIKLKSVTLPDSITSIGSNAFYYCQRLTSIEIPGGVTSIGDSAFAGCERLTNVTIPDSVTNIGACAFMNCDKLENITLSNNVTSISNYTFCGCGNIESITIPDSVTSIGEAAFAYCYKLKSITLPDNLISIGDSAFENCVSLMVIYIPDSVTSIGDSAFSGCSVVRNITIGKSVTSIGEYAFYSCYDVTNFTFNGTVAQWNAIELCDDWDYNSSILRIDCSDGATCKEHIEVIFPAVEPTCGNAGCTEGVWCENCGAFSVESEEIPALPHHTVLNWECGAFDYHQGKCNVCHHYVIERHDMVDGICTGCGSDGESICGTSRDEVDLQSDDMCGGYPMFSPGSYSSWDNVAFADTTIDSIRVWGWVGFSDYTPGIYGYSIDGGEIVYDESFSVEPEFPVYVTGGASATRYQVYVPILDLECGTYEIKIYTKTSSDKEIMIMAFTLEKSEEYEIPKTGHNFYDIVETQPTCTEIGGTTYYCDCGYSYTENEIAALGHTNSDVYEENYCEPTCCENGGYDKVIYCTTCGEEVSREHTDLPANGHTPADAVEENRYEPTYDAAGGYELAVYCTTCGEELSREYVEIPRLRHNVSVWECRDRYEHGGRCEDCQMYVYEEHNMVDGICIDCGADGESICHVSRDEVELKAEEICGGVQMFTPGYYDSWDRIANIDMSIATIRVWGWVAFAEPIPGIYGYSINGGDIIYDESFTVEAEFGPGMGGGESITRYRVFVPVYELESGTYEIRIFTKTSSDKEFVIVTFTVVKSEENEISKPRHSYESITTEPTCTENGYTTYTCHCGYGYEGDVVKAHGHAASIPFEENRVEPTCTENGNCDVVVCCTICGEELSREYTEIEALGHSMNAWYQTVAPTCTTEGENRRGCHRCDFTETEIVPANGHTASNEAKENRVEPTCTAIGGYDTVVYCTVCKVELSREHTEIPANGHTYESEVTAPTCTDKGYTKHTCHCGDTYTDNEVAAPGHISSDWIVDVEAQIGVEGSQHKECTVCGGMLITETIKALTETDTSAAEATNNCSGTVSASVVILALISCMMIAWRPRKEN